MGGVSWQPMIRHEGMGKIMCDSSLIVIVVLLVVALLVSLLALIFAAKRTAQPQAVKAAYFAFKYGSSVDRMLAECPADRDQLRLIRDGDRSGAPKAVRELLRSEPVPLRAAAEFIKRI